MVRADLVFFGSGLILAAFAPTPDDITIVSPIAQFVLGTTLVIVGLRSKGGK